MRLNFWQKLKNVIGDFRHQETTPPKPPVDVEYKEFVCTIEPKSSFLTPLQADTLWAALMWAHAYMHGDSHETRKLVESYPPKILVSDGFPQGYLPKPKGFIPIDQVATIVRNEYPGNWEKQLMGIEIAKRLSEQQLLPVELVNRLVAGQQSKENLLKELLQVQWCPKRFVVLRQELLTASDYQETLDRINQYCNAERCDAVTPWASPHKQESHENCARILNSDHLKYLTLVKQSRSRKNRIDRILMRAMDENGLFSQEEEYLLRNFWWVFVKVHPEFDADEVRNLFRNLAEQGYGRRKSVGKGQFFFSRFVPLQDFTDAHPPQGAEDSDGFMTLSSSYVPHHSEFTQGHYTTHIKRGKVDGHLASTGKFLKKPIVMYEAGSVFQTDRIQPFYGKVVEEIYQASEGENIVQYGYAYPMKGKFFS